MSRPAHKGMAALLALVACAAMAVPSATSIDAAHSRVTATFTQMNVAVEAPFTQLSGSIHFDAAHPEAASARIEVVTASLDLGDADYNAEAAKAEWLNAAAFPKAVFVATNIKPLAADRFLATGTLTLKGRVLPVQVPVTVRREAAATRFDGSLAISRKAFAIGDASWNEVLADVVTVKFQFIQPR